MTERKPRAMSFTSWIDQQISEAAERGAFDDLPGAGKPLPKRQEFDGQAWLRDYVVREGGTVTDCLPIPLRLRRESETLAQTVRDMSSEQQVRDAVGELNQQIMHWRRLPLGPPIFVPLVDAEAMVGIWREAQPAAREEMSQADVVVRTTTARRGLSPWRRRDRVQNG
jgi:hypothetical protein